MRIKERGFRLRLATCCARIAGLFASLAFVSLTDGKDCDLEATEGPRHVCFDGWWLQILLESHGWPSSPSCCPHFLCLCQLLRLFHPHFYDHLATFYFLKSLASSLCSPSLPPTCLPLSSSYWPIHLFNSLPDYPSCIILLKPDIKSSFDAV